MALKWEKGIPGVVVKGGYVGGQVVTADEVKVLSESPSKKESWLVESLEAYLQTCTAALSAVELKRVSIGVSSQAASERGQG